MNIYKSSILTYPALSNGDSLTIQRHIEFLEKLDREREAIYLSLDELADIRYIFSQRVIFYISGENDRQYGFFSTLFAFIFASVLLLQIMEYFSISKPFKDIMLFLRDMSQGKRGQRLYFSSFVKEIKESEDIINEFVSKAEEHEKEK